MIDGEADESGRPSFNDLQNYGSAHVSIFYYVFDALVLDGRNVMSAPLSVRRELLRERILPGLGDPIRHSPGAERQPGRSGSVHPGAGASLAQLMAAGKENLYKVKAYQPAAARLRTFSESIDELVSEGADLYRSIGTLAASAIRR